MVCADMCIHNVHSSTFDLLETCVAFSTKWQKVINSARVLRLLIFSDLLHIFQTTCYMCFLSHQAHFATKVGYKDHQSCCLGSVVRCTFTFSFKQHLLWNCWDIFFFLQKTRLSYSFVKIFHPKTHSNRTLTAYCISHSTEG